MFILPLTSLHKLGYAGIFKMADNCCMLNNLEHFHKISQQLNGIDKRKYKIKYSVIMPNKYKEYIFLLPLSVNVLLDY